MSSFRGKMTHFREKNTRKYGIQYSKKGWTGIWRYSPEIAVQNAFMYNTN